MNTKNKLLNSPITRRNVVKSGTAAVYLLQSVVYHFLLMQKQSITLKTQHPLKKKPFGVHVPLTVVAVAYYAFMFVTMRYIGLSLIPPGKMSMVIIK